MALDLINYEPKARKAVKLFWTSRQEARQKQLESGKADQGERAGVTAGKNMDGFLKLAIEVIKANGLSDAQFHQNRALLTLPGYFRPTKLWETKSLNTILSNYQNHRICASHSPNIHTHILTV